VRRVEAGGFEVMRGKSGFLRIAEFWLPVAGYIALIFSVSSIPQLPTPTQWDYSDKVAHLVEYGILGWLFHRGFENGFRFTLRGSVPLMTLSLGLLVGAVDETIQSFVPGRQSSLADLAADLGGLSLAEVLLWKLKGKLPLLKSGLKHVFGARGGSR